MTAIRLWSGLIGLAGSLAAGASLAAEPTGQPEPWELYYQRAVSPIMERVTDLHNLLIVIITVITLFVLVLLGICVVKFNSKANPTPSKTTHNTLLEIAWTTLPVIILVVIAVPSFKLIYYYDKVPDAEMTIKATGNQWFWSYEYPDNGALGFDSIMLSEDARAADPSAGPRLLAVDNELVVPTGRVVRMQVIGADVIHSFAMPAFGVKIDAVPGRLNETWFRVDREGMYYGQCSELCGRDHAFMPIAIRAVSPAAFEAWVTTAAADLEGAYQQLAATPADGNIVVAGE